MPESTLERKKGIYHSFRHNFHVHNFTPLLVKRVEFGHATTVRIGIAQGKEILFRLFDVEGEGEGQDAVVGVFRGPVVIDLGRGKALPSAPGGGPDDRGHPTLEKVLRLAEVDDVEDDPLVLLDVLHGEVEPEPDPRVAGVRTDEQVVLVLGDEIDSAQISCDGNKKKENAQQRRKTTAENGETFAQHAKVATRRPKKELLVC